MALRCEDVFSKSSNKESAVITAAWECKGVIGESEEAYSRPRAQCSVTKSQMRISKALQDLWAK